MAGGRLHAWRDEHRQHVDPRPDLDYGPFGFMEAFDAAPYLQPYRPGGRYAYNMQPQIGHWNCYALGQALLPLIGAVDDTQAALEVYQPEYAGMLDRLLHAKLGLRTVEAGDDGLLDAHVRNDASQSCRFHAVFSAASANCSSTIRSATRRCATCSSTARPSMPGQPNTAQRLQQENSRDGERRLAMHAVNPKYVLRNYLAQVAIEKAQNRRLFRSGPPARGAGTSVRRTARTCRLCRAAAGLGQPPGSQLFLLIERRMQ